MLNGCECVILYGEMLLIFNYPIEHCVLMLSILVSPLQPLIQLKSQDHDDKCREG